MAPPGTLATSGSKLRPLWVLLLAFAAALVCASPAAAAVTKKQAASRAIDALGSDDGNAAVIVFGLPKPLKAGTKITQAGTPKPTRGGTDGLSSNLRAAGVRTVKAPRVLTARARSYLFYEDRGPYQLYQHPGRVALVNVATGKVTLSKTITWPPLVANRLPAFLRSSAAYRSSKYQVLNQPWRVPGAQQKPPLANRNLFDRDPFGPGRPLPSRANFKRVAERLAAERSCVLRVTDTLPSFWNANELNMTRSYVGTLFEQLERDNSAFLDDRYGARSGETLAEAVDRLVDAGCRDVLLYIAGQGYTSSGEPVIHLGTSVRKGGLLAQQNISATNLRNLVSARPGVTFKFKIDAPYAGGMIDRLRDLQNVLLIETASAPGDEAFAFVPAVQNGGGQMVTSSENPAGLLEFTNCELIGLKAFFDSEEEIDRAHQAQNEGVSFLVEMLARSQELCKAGAIGFAHDLGSGPQLYALKRGSGKGTNLPPKANPQDVSVTEDTPKAITLTGSDPDGDTLAFSITKQPDHGTLSGTPPNVTYTPGADYIGPDDFNFKVDDGKGMSNTARVDVTVSEGNDAPVLTTTSGSTPFTEDGASVAIDGGLTVSDVDDTQFERATVKVRAGDFQAGDELKFVDKPGITGSYNSGTGVLTLTGTASESDYQAALRSVEFDSDNQDPDTSKAIDFTVNDGDADSAVATKNVTVTPVNDRPVLDTTDAALGYTEDSGEQPVDAGITAADVDSANLTGAVVQITSNHVQAEDDLTFSNSNGLGITGSYNDSTGTMTLTGNQSVANYQAALRLVKYVNNSNNPSTVTRTVSFQANDGAAANNLSTVVTRNITITPTDDGPDAIDDTASVAEDSTDNPIDVLANDTDVDGGPKEITAVTTTTAHGTASIDQGTPDRLLYTPAGDYCGSDSITYTVTGGDTATVSVTVTCSPDDPTANDDQATRDEDSGALDVPVLANDTDPDTGDTITIDEATDPSRGTVVLTGGSPNAHTGLTYAPDANYCNTQSGGTPDTFTYKINGGDTATVSMTVTCVNDPTVAVDDSRAFDEDPPSPVTIDVRANDTDEDLPFGGSKELITGKTNGTHGTVVITNGGADLTYAPAANYCGSDTFTYTLAGGDSADVSITVNCVDDPPTANDDTHSPAIAEDTSTPTAIDVLANDDNDDGGPMKIDSKTNGLNGATVTITGGGTGIEYTPAANFCGNDTFTYTLDPGNDSATVTVPVTCSNDAPVADLNGTGPGASGIDTTATFSEPVTDGEGNPTAIAPDAEALDPDAPASDSTLDSARITLTNRPDGDSFESLSATASGPITVEAYNPATGVLDLTTPVGEATLSEWSTVLRSVKYDNTAASPSSANRTITVTLNDGELDSSPASTVTLSVVPQNLKPTLDLNGAGSGEDASVNFAEGDSAVLLAPAAEAVDADDPELASATISLTNHPDGSAEAITVDTTLATSLGVTVTGDGTHTIGLSGAQPVDDYEQVLRTARYSNTSQNPDTASRSITFVVNDGQDASDTRTSTVTMSAVNDPPVNTVNSSAIAMNEDGTYTLTGSDLSFADPDATSLEITMTATDGTMSISDTTGLTPTGGTTDVATLNFTGSISTINSKIAAGHFTFKPTANYNGNASIQVTSDDGGATGSGGPQSDTDSLTFNVAAVNDPVSVDPVPNTLVVDEDTEGTFSPSPQIADADAEPVKVTLTVAKGRLTLASTTDLAFTAGDGTSDATMTFSGPLSAVNAALNGLKYTGNQDEDTDDQLSIAVDDQKGSTDSKNVTIDIVPVNDAPNGVDDTFDGTKSAIGNTTLIADADNDDEPNVSHANKSIDGNVLANDTDVDGPTPRTVKPETDKATTNGGRVTIEADGDFVFHPEPGASCTDNTDSFTYTVVDAFSPTPAEDPTPATVTINLEGCVWYVDNNHSGTPDDEGTARAPFNTLEQGETNSLAGHTVFVLDSGTKYTASASYTMNSNERLIGEHEGLVVDPDGSASTYGADTLKAATTGAHPVLTSSTSSDDVIDLAGGVEVRGFDVDPALGGGGICGGAACGGQVSSGSTIDDVNVNDTGSGAEVGGQPGLELNATTGTHAITDFTYANPDASYAAAGISLTNAGVVEFGVGDEGEPTKVNKNGGPALVSAGTRLGTSTFDELTAAGSGAGGVNVSGATGANNVKFGDGDGNDLLLTTTGGLDPAFRLSGNAGSWSVPSSGTANISATGGAAVDIANTVGSGYHFDDVDSTNSSNASGASGDGINLAEIGSSPFSATSGDIKGHTGIAFDLSGGNGTVEYPGGIGDVGAGVNDGSGDAARIQNRNGGSVTLNGSAEDDNDTGGGISLSGNTAGTTLFGGASMQLNTGSVPGVSIAHPDGGSHAVTFSGTLDIDTTSGNGFSATGVGGAPDGSVVATGSGSTIDTGTGRALTVTNTTIGNADLTFRAISSNAAASGITLTNTSNGNGSLTVQGNGGTCNSAAACTGGAIVNSTGRGVSLTDVPGGVSLTRLAVIDSADDGIGGSGLSGLTLDNAHISSNGNANGDHGVDFTQLTGTSPFTGSNVSDNFDSNVSVENASGTLNLNVTNGTYSRATGGAGDAISVEATGTGSHNLNVQGPITFADNVGDHVQHQSTPSSTSDNDVTINNATMTSPPAPGGGPFCANSILGGGITVVGGGPVNGGGSNADVTITSNNIQNSCIGAIAVGTTGSVADQQIANVDATITGNTIGTAGVAGSGSVQGNGIFVDSNGNSNVRALITNNQVRQWTNRSGLFLDVIDGDASLDATVKGNVFTAPNSASVATTTRGMTLQLGTAQAGDSIDACLDIGDPGTAALKNQVAGTGESPQPDVRYLHEGPGSVVKLAGYAGVASPTIADIANWFQPRNNLGGTPTVTGTGSTAGPPASTTQGAASCALHAN